jgi:hypothetical protein
MAHDEDRRVRIAQEVAGQHVQVRPDLRTQVRAVHVEQDAVRHPHDQFGAGVDHVDVVGEALVELGLLPVELLADGAAHDRADGRRGGGRGAGVVAVNVRADEPADDGARGGADLRVRGPGARLDAGRRAP